VNTLQEKLTDPSHFAIGVELVSTRGTMDDIQAVSARGFAKQLVQCHSVDWVSITDNAGGNPQLSPMALGKPILYAGKDVVIHLSCKDFNRNGLESEAWQLSSEGFHNILALSGDYPSVGYEGQAAPVFDIDSVGLLTMLTEMNRGLARSRAIPNSPSKTIAATEFYLGAVATNFKRFENEVIPQLLKLEKKIQCGAEFIIAQIGYDARKSHEMLCYMQERGLSGVPLVGNVYLLTTAIARFFRKQTIPGVVISDRLLEECERQGKSADKGYSFYRELAAKQLAIFRGLGFAGGYLGGMHNIDQMCGVLDVEATFSRDDWRQFAAEIQYPVTQEFYVYAQDSGSKLADHKRRNVEYEASLKRRTATGNVTWSYRFSKLIHKLVFTPGRRLHRFARSLYARATNPAQGPPVLRIIEHASKAAIFQCKDCGDCSLPEIAYLCPESQCAKNQRNGPCGGTRDGKCEVAEFECIWARAYDRLKFEGRTLQLLDHAPVMQDNLLRGTSSWGNALLEKDHVAKRSSCRPLSSNNSNATGGDSSSRATILGNILNVDHRTTGAAGAAANVNAPTAL
jgi:methylenetetrahydrofolate reductase (NADPH)